MKTSLLSNSLMLFSKRRIKLVCKAAILICSAQYGLNAQDYVTHNFNDGDFFPYVVPKADQIARVKIVNKRLETHWDESLYNGTNSGRKAQIKQAAGDHSNGEVRFTQHIWMGFWLKIHDDYMKENTNTNAGLMQIWGYNPNGAANHMCMLKFDGRNGGALVWQHRYNSVANKTHLLVYPNFPRDQFVRVVMHVKLAEKNKGIVQIWVDDELRVNKTNQTIGWGDQNASGMINGTYAFGTSIGQYNYLQDAGYDDAYDGNNHLFDGHMQGETRTVTYDEVSLYNGADGYSLVDPNHGELPGEGQTTTPTSTPTTTGGNVVHITKRNATGFAIDGNKNAANSQNVYLWAENDNNVNQQWVEIDRGNGYYSYQKMGTNHCIDGGGDGANRQNVYLWQCGDNNQNQHWQKVSVGGGAFKLVKRNASGFALNGGSNGENAQNVSLWNSGSTSQNLHWIITPTGTSAKSIAEEVLVNDVIIYPNPVESLATIEGAANSIIRVYDISGQELLVKEVLTDNEVLDLSTLSTGVYYAQVEGLQNISVIKIVKQ